MAEEEIDNIYPYVVMVEIDPDTEEENIRSFRDYEQAEKHFSFCRRTFDCKIEFYEQNMNKCRIKTFATYYGS